jgi:hypothetical protein
VSEFVASFKPKVSLSLGETQAPAAVQAINGNRENVRNCVQSVHIYRNKV